jgi:hypothetical protein
MNDREFDEYIKSRIRKEEAEKSVPLLDHVFEAAIHRAGSDQVVLVAKQGVSATNCSPRKRFYQFLLSAAILVFTLAVGLTFLLQKEEAGNKAIQQKQEESPKNGTAMKVDIEKEKQTLAAAGFETSRSGMPTEESAGSSEKDIAYNFTLKDYVYQSSQIVKGKVVGTKTYISGDGIVLTEVKMLVKDSLMGPAKPGQMFTFVSSGGIITRYDFTKLHGIDTKFNMSESELEPLKKEWVAEDYGMGIIYPDDDMYVFVGEDTRVTPNGRKVPWIGFRIKFTGGKIGAGAPHFELEHTFAYEELRAMKSIEELEVELRNNVLDKKGYSPYKAREAAFNALPEETRRMITNRDSASVVFLSKAMVEGESATSELIEVIFQGREHLKVYLDAKTLKVYKLIKSMEGKQYNFKNLKADLEAGKKIEFNYIGSYWMLEAKQGGWTLKKNGESPGEFFESTEDLLVRGALDNETFETVFSSSKAEYVITIE